MQSRTTATTEVSFDSESQSNQQLEITTDSGYFSWGVGTRLRLYPPVPALLRATCGTISDLGIIRDEYVSEIISFSGSKTSQLKRVPFGSVTFESIEISFDSEGNDVGPVIHYDSENQQAVSDIIFYGGIKATYMCQYKLLKYMPSIENIPVGGGNYATNISSGTVYAFYNKQMTSHQISFNTSDEPVYVECYRLYDKIVLDENGSHEAPDNWPDSGSYQASPNSYVDPTNSFTEERTHEIGYISYIGSISYYSFSARVLDPFTTTTSIGEDRRQYYLRFSSPPSSGQNVANWRRVFAGIDRASILSRVQSKYGGVLLQ
jgi:hypothetical protein